ncbi:MAG: VLRF1 family aeRF1-type release factor [Longimicrobiales bacterium]
MIRRTDIQRLIDSPPRDRPVVSLYLDMAVNSENKRTFNVFLNKQKSRFAELDSDREPHHRVALGATFDGIERWIDEEFDEANKGIALFAEVGGDRLDAFQFPVRVQNRLEIGDWPVIGPLTEILVSNPAYGVILVDREHLRLVRIRLGEVRQERRFAPDAYPTAHDVHAGGVATKDFQRRKAEEVRHFFKEFAHEVAEFDRQHDIDAFVLLGTNENVQQFRDFLAASITDRVIHNAQAPIDASGAEILERLQRVFSQTAERDAASAIDLVHDRVRHQHRAVAGIGPTLEQLQEGKIDRLVIARDLESEGAQCTRCGFYLAHPSNDGACPYCGGQVRHGIDLVESMLRIAAHQQVALEFVDRDAMSDLAGVGALLRF